MERVSRERNLGLAGKEKGTRKKKRESLRAQSAKQLLTDRSV